MSEEENYPSSEEESEEDELHHPRLAEDDSDDSDRELQVAYKSGLLKPGLYSEAKPERPAVNNVDGILEKLEEIEQKDMDWLERLDITVERRSKTDEMFEEGLSAAEAQAQAQSRLFTVHNDFKRELMFLTQAKDAVLKAIPLLKIANISTVRPEDYFAEMAKKDDHMKKVRQKLLSLQRRKESAEKYRNQLKLKKYGKKVQQAVELERKKKKREILDSVKKFRKGKTDSMDFLDDEREVKPGKKSQLQKVEQQRKKSRTFRNKKFGFGGKKKGMKSNTVKSVNDVSGFKQPRGKKNFNNKRPGKGKRQQMKNRNK
ncbi:putative rRNA-processing protein EBP2 [Styela clava]